jgi:hypothetical protein
VKANIFKQKTFYLKSLEVDFGECLLEEKSRVQGIVLTNTSQKKRSYTIVADESGFEYCIPQLSFKLEKVHT